MRLFLCIIKVRCRAEGMKLRSSVTRNGTSDECSRASSGGSSGSGGAGGGYNNFHLSFWLYLVFRTIGEAAIIGSLLLLRIVTLNADTLASMQAATPQVITTISTGGGGGISVAPTVKWWVWALGGFVIVGPLAGWVADCVGFGIAFLIGSVMFSLAAFCIALSPSRHRRSHRRSSIPGLAQQEDEDDEENDDILLHHHQEAEEHRVALYRISSRDLFALLSNKQGPSLWILFFILLMGMSAATVPTALYW